VYAGTGCTTGDALLGGMSKSVVAAGSAAAVYVRLSVSA